jgi:hypothetical protein
MMLHICPYYDKRDAIDTTSRSKTWGKGLSPFFLGPCKLYGGYTSRNVENGWQYSKVYPEHVDESGNPSEAYFAWARAGWDKMRADRYPMGKGKKPLYSWWDGEKMDYVTARRRIYVPLYANAVVKSEAFAILKSLNDSGDLTLRDFDGYDHVAQGKSLKDVLLDPNKKMGHAFVLALMLTPPEEWDRKDST